MTNSSLLKMAVDIVDDYPSKRVWIFPCSVCVYQWVSDMYGSDINTIENHSMSYIYILVGLCWYFPFLEYQRLFESRMQKRVESPNSSSSSVLNTAHLKSTQKTQQDQLWKPPNRWKSEPRLTFRGNSLFYPFLGY